MAVPKRSWKGWSRGMKKSVALLFILSVALCASCPSGYHQDRQYCMPNSKNAKPIHPKIGSSCPSGWHSDGNWCVVNSSNSKQIMAKKGNSCPSGWHSDSQYCVSNR